ncbi:MAG: pentapeptide repeat-containing protein, partial [Methylobacter sp.]|nr:pentapeptide repeat-containing protein [Methylobacter sp.]
ISLVVVATGICQRQVCYYVLLLTALAFAGLSTWFCSAWQLDVANGFIKNVNGAYLEHLLPRLVVTNRLFIKVDEDEKRALEMLTDYQNAQNQPNVDSPQAKQVMKSVATAKSSTEEGNETARQWWQQGARQDWEGRSFNFADLSGSLMARANLKFAKLEGASLYRAQLQGANLSMAQMRGATLIDAQMQEVDLGMALLQGAFLGRARMQEARLSGAQMQGANLGMAQMQGADLRGTQMQGAYLYSAQMQGANLSHARMQGADLMGAQMQGVVLTEAQMQGTDVSWAQLQGAYCLSTEGLQTQFRNSERIGKASELDNCQKTGTFGALDQEAVDTIITQLPGNLSYPFRTQVIERLGQPANQGKAICGKLTPEMAQIIEAHWNDRVPRGITAQWAKQSHFCFPSTLDKKAMP